MKECSKAIPRRLAHPNFARRYFVGDGIDIGGASDPLALYAGLFPLIRSVRTWDLDDGDAVHMAGVADGSYDFVHSSHCLEHLTDPAAASTSRSYDDTTTVTSAPATNASSRSRVARAESIAASIAAGSPRISAARCSRR